MTKLNNVLASLAVLNQKVYNMHWNVKGDFFMSTHKMTEAFFEQATELIDDIAEKIVMDDKVPFSTFADWLKNSKIKEEKSKTFSYKEISKTIVLDLDILQKQVDEVTGTNVVQPLLDEIYMFIDKQRWLFKSII